ncbi:MAG: hypothetical protein RIB45_14695 [Marivibrio sp.]|uniref:hypothetical protein n=1 Tax=Marivibrio sp. TaxID=2039719 RepID=UPI0032EBC591
MKRTTFALTLAAAVAAPAAGALAEDCGARINQVAAHPAIETETAVDGETVVKRGDAIETEGGTTTYSESGPAVPRENWFGDAPQFSALLGYLETAIEHNERGDEAACNEAVGEAEDLLKKHGSG